MSTDRGFHLYQAVVHHVDAQGVVHVRVPGLLGGAVVPVEAPITTETFRSPAVGDQRFIAVNNDLSRVVWPVALDDTVSASEVSFSSNVGFLSVPPVSNVSQALNQLDFYLGNVDDAVTAVDGAVDALTTEVNGMIVSGSYTPTLSNITLGTGGSPSNTAVYMFIGGTGVGDTGLMHLSGQIVLGTTGEAMGSAPTIAVPSGFQIVVGVTGTTNRLGIATMSAGGVNAIGFMQYATSTTLGVIAINAASTYAAGTTVNSGNPGTWADGDSITWNAVIRATRV